MATEVNIKNGGGSSKWVLLLLFALICSIAGCAYYYNKNKQSKAKVTMLSQNVYALTNKVAKKQVKLTPTVTVNTGEVTRLSLSLKTYQDLYAEQAKEVEKLTKRLSDVSSVATANIVAADTVAAQTIHKKDTTKYVYTGKYASIVNTVVKDSATFAYSYKLKLKVINTIEYHRLLFGLIKLGEKSRKSQIVLYDENARIESFDQIDIYK